MSSDLISTLASTYHRCTRLVDRALADLSDAQAGHRSRDGEGSSITFIAGHLLACRASLLSWFGSRDSNPWRETFGAGATPRSAAEYPPIAELRAQWSEVGREFHNMLEGLEAATILATSPHKVPGDDQSNRGLLQDLGFHECYHLGQIGMLRTDQRLPSLQSLEDSGSS